MSIMWINVLQTVGVLYLVVSFAMLSVLLPALVKKRLDPDKVGFPKLFFLFSVGLLLLTFVWPILLLFLWTVKPEVE